ncbi:hypothetical protein [Streptomyces sp. LN549]
MNVAAQPHLGILVPYLACTGPSAVTSATAKASQPVCPCATNLPAG